MEHWNTLFKQSHAGIFGKRARYFHIEWVELNGKNPRKVVTWTDLFPEKYVRVMIRKGIISAASEMDWAKFYLNSSKVKSISSKIDSISISKFDFKIGLRV